VDVPGQGESGESDWIIAKICVTSKTCRRSSRSIQTPANGAKMKVGICPANPTTPSKKAERVSRYTSQLVARRVIQVPIREMHWPPKYKRKFRWRNDRQAREMPGLLTEEEDFEEISALTGFHCAT
jgi:hypothetical protein